MTPPEMQMLPPDGLGTDVGPYAEVDALVGAVLAAKGADPAMVESLPPLSDEMVTPELQEMLAGMGLAAPADPEGDMWAEAEAADAAAIPCAECPDPAGCREAGICAMGLA
jgi:hypothetical protein